MSGSSSPWWCMLPFGACVLSGFLVRRMCSIRLLKMSTAAKTAALIELSSAFPVPAMSYAVPWSGEVRMRGRQAVKLTPSLKAMVLNGISPWSWYIARVASNDLYAPLPKKPSAEYGPNT